MDYILEPSLDRTALVKVVATLWNQDDVRNLFAEFHYRQLKNPYAEFNYTELMEMETIVVKKIEKLPLPKQMKEKILCFIRPIGIEIYKWRHFNYKDCHLRIDLPNEFCWTSQGTIDKKKTAAVMIKDKRIDIATRYKLACIYCLEDDIPKLWRKIYVRDRQNFFSETGDFVLELVKLWTFYMKGNTSKVNRMIKKALGYTVSPYQYGILEAAYGGNRVAAEYFLQKVPSDEKTVLVTAMEIAVENFLGDRYPDILFFLLSILDEEEQLRVFKSNPFQVLLYLLDWPLQNFFMETASRMWDVLEKEHYVDLLKEILRKIKDGYKDCNYQKMFGEFWQQSPNDYKKYVLSKDTICDILSDLFMIRDEDNIRLIFQEATIEEKKYLICDDMAQGICKELINSNQLCLLKYFIKECLPSKEEVIKFKEDFQNGDVWHANEHPMSNLQQKFLHMLDDIISEFKKRKCEEGDSSKAKRM